MAVPRTGRLIEQRSMSTIFRISACSDQSLRSGQFLGISIRIEQMLRVNDFQNVYCQAVIYTPDSLFQTKVALDHLYYGNYRPQFDGTPISLPIPPNTPPETPPII